MNAIRKIVRNEQSQPYMFSPSQLDDLIDLLISARANNCPLEIQASGANDDWKLHLSQGHYASGTLHGEVGLSVYTDDTDVD